MVSVFVRPAGLGLARIRALLQASWGQATGREIADQDDHVNLKGNSRIWW